jgi:hypothetical protein
MNISELKQSKYLKKEDVEPSVTATVKGLKKQNVALEGEESDMRGVLYFKEYDKGMVLNQTNIDMMVEITGSSETDNWTSQRIVLYNDPRVMYGGKRVGGIRIRAVSEGEIRPKRNHFAKELVENYNEPTVDQVNRDLAEASELNRRKHQPSNQPVEDDSDLPF